MATTSDLYLDHALTEAELLRLSSSQTYFRGEQYRSRCAVRGLRLEDGTLAGEVQGRMMYRCRLRLEGGGLSGDCICRRIMGVASASIWWRWGSRTFRHGACRGRWPAFPRRRRRRVSRRAVGRSC